MLLRFDRTGAFGEHGVMMSADRLNTMRNLDPILLGCEGDLDMSDHIARWALRLKSCQGFDQYTSVRPTGSLPGVDAPSKRRETEHLNRRSCANTEQANSPVSVAARIRVIRLKSPRTSRS